MTRPFPAVRVSADGTPLPADATGSLTSVFVSQRLSQPTLCELVFIDRSGPADLSDRLGPGVGLAIRLDEHATDLFHGEVTAYEFHHTSGGERTWHVRAYDLLHRLRKREHVRSYAQLNPAELARELVGALGLRVIAHATGPAWEHLLQYQQTDLDLLAEVLDRSGLFYSLREDGVHLLSSEGAGDPVELSIGSGLLDAAVEVSGETACSEIDASAWHPLAVRSHRVRVRGPHLGRDVAAGVAASSVGGAEVRALTGGVVQSEAQLEATARAVLDRRANREVTLRGVAEGDPRLRPGIPVVVRGLPHALNGRYVLTSVDHLIDPERGYVTEVSSAPAAPARPPRGCQVMLGVVIAVNDPQAGGRIQVALPAVQDVASGWLPVVAPGAGANKGLLAVPGIGDSVLVLMPNDDPTQGMVLGGMYGPTGPPDAGVEGGDVRRFTFQSPTGQRIVLDGESGTLLLDDAAGSRLELSPGRVRLSAAGDLELEAPGGTIRIRGQHVDFERA